MINICGMIESGKSQYAPLVAEALATEAYAINENNPLTRKFHRSPVDDMFLSHIHHVMERFELMKQASLHPRYVLNRHMTEDILFSQVAYDLGRLTKDELTVHNNLAKSMISYIDDQGVPELYIYLKCEHKTISNRINWDFYPQEKRGVIEEFYTALHARYDSWMTEQVEPKELMVIDVDKRNIESENERPEIIRDIILRIESMGI